MDAGLLATNMAVRQLLVLTFSVLFAPKPIIFATPTASPLLIGQLWTTGHGPVIRTEAISVLTFGERPFAHSHGAVVIQKLLTASGLVDQGYVESALSTTTLTFAMVVKKNSIIKPALPTQTSPATIAEKYIQGRLDDTWQWLTGSLPSRPVPNLRTPSKSKVTLLDT